MGVQVTKEESNLPRLCRDKEESEFPLKSALTPENEPSPQLLTSGRSAGSKRQKQYKHRSVPFVKGKQPTPTFQELGISTQARLGVVGRIMPPLNMSLF